MKTKTDWPSTHCPNPACEAEPNEPCVTHKGEEASQPHSNRRTEEDIAKMTFGRPENELVYNPPEDRIIEDGQFVTVIRPPHAEGFKWVTMGMTFWAEHGDTVHSKGFLPDGTYKIEALTPEGSLHLFPHEYAVLGDEMIRELYSEDELEFHANEFDSENLSEMIHYMQSRGISKSKAMGMAVGSMDENVGWFEPTEQIKLMLELRLGSFNRSDRYGLQ